MLKSTLCWFMSAKIYHWRHTNCLWTWNRWTIIIILISKHTIGIIHNSCIYCLKLILDFWKHLKGEIEKVSIEAFGSNSKQQGIIKLTCYINIKVSLFINQFFIVVIHESLKKNFQLKPLVNLLNGIFLKVAFSQKGLIRLSFLQADKPNYFPVLC